jgi:hypothetical protein
MNHRTWKLLVLTLVLSVAPAFAGAAPAVNQTPVLCAGDSLSSIFAPAVQASASTDLFAPQPVNQDQPICQVLCVTSQCSSNADCTAAPNGRCNFACPGVGCCVYR